MIGTRIRRIGAPAAGLAAVMALISAAPVPGTAATVAAVARSVQRSSAVVVTTVGINPAGRTYGRLGDGFIGLSYSSGTINDGNYAPLGNLPALLANLGRSVIRFGGSSVDYSSYTGITSAALTGLAQLAAKTGWKVLYTVNLGHFNAAQATADSRNVRIGLGASLYGIACGNEPDRFAGRERPSNYTEQDYLTKDLPACYKAVRAGAPRTLFTGPDIFRPVWLPPYVAAEKGVVQRLVDQFYPMSHCNGSVSNGAATLLSSAMVVREDKILREVKVAAAVDRVPFIIGETNSASCGGLPGVSDTYVSALWAADWVLIGAEYGAQGMYFNGSLATKCITYTPLCEVGNWQYAARPVYYGMLFAHLMGTGWTLPVKLSTTADVHVHAVRNSPGVIRVMVENLSGAATRVVLRVPGVSGRASTLNLTGPSLAATTGVRIQGAAVTAAGTFKPGAAGHVACAAGTCSLTVPAYTAVIVILPRLKG